MSKKVIWAVTIMMGIAMTAFFILQFYWIKSAAHIQSEQFDQLVSRSLIDIANKIEYNETERIAGKLVSSISDTGRRLSIRTPNVPGVTSAAPSNTLQDGSSIADTTGNNSGLNAIEGKEMLINHILANIYNLPRNIEERLDQTELTETINSVLEESGLGNLKYEYAVTGWDGKTAFSSPGYIAGEQTVYKVRLFPYDIIPNSNYLNVYFPDRDKSMFGTVGFMSLFSMILSFFIVAGFILTVFVMFKQKKMSEIRNDFVSNMTHELKTPISTISLAAQMLGDKSIPSELINQDNISKIIKEECRRLGSQVEKVLQTAIFDKGKLKLHIQEVDLHEIISSAIENFSVQVRSRNGKITNDLKATEHIIQADQVHITNVLFNLLDNAVKYCIREPKIHIETSNHGRYLTMSISDNGIGISKNDQKRIFEKFYRVPTGNIHTVKGFGLGLSYVRMIVEEHGGYVEVESELYEGSKFNISLPLKD